jgi:heme/copper-type cytochrome/quinol oxidase subunit 2
MPFTLQTILPIFVACIFSLISFLISFQSSQKYIQEKINISKISYIIIIALPTLISILLAVISVMMGGIDYTAYQAQVS